MPALLESYKDPSSTSFTHSTLTQFYIVQLCTSPNI